jgi:hypothetical protein
MLGAKARAAVWLVNEVGVGGTFTKQALRAAFPGVAQIDRRVRDLRAEGWVITTYREDRSLASDEQRLVTIGGHVWEPGYRSRQAAAVTDRARQATLAADGYACTACGIAGGESYPDDALRIAKLLVRRSQGAVDSRLRTLCDRCSVGIVAGEGVALSEFFTLVEELESLDRASLAAWVAADSRPRSPVERAWMAYRRLSATERAEAARQLGRQ